MLIVTKQSSSWKKRWLSFSMGNMTNIIINVTFLFITVLHKCFVSRVSEASQFTQSLCRVFQ